MVLAAEPPSILVHAWLGADFVTHVHPVRSERLRVRHMRRIAGIVVIAAAATACGGRAGLRAGRSSPSSARAGRPGATTSSSSSATRSAAPVDDRGLGAAGLRRTASGNPSTRATVPAGVTLAPGQAYLFANTQRSRAYSGAVRADQTLRDRLHRLRRDATASPASASSNRHGTVIDGVGSPQSPCREGTGHHDAGARTATTPSSAPAAPPTPTTTRPTSKARSRATRRTASRTGPGRRGAGGDRLRPRQRRRERRPRHEHPRHVLASP